jgi:UPF0042 nucleotide-binding protein
MRIILITGISGSGKSVGLNSLEDAGYFCVDNLPPSLLRALVETRVAEEGAENLAVAVDARSAGSLSGLTADVQLLKKEGHDVKVLFLTSTTEALVARFSETRRSHPLSHRYSLSDNPPTLIECILTEREMLAEIENLGHVIDTSQLSAGKLRTFIRGLVDSKSTPLTLLFQSFAFKYGVPLDADLVFDVRMLPNPFYDLTLRPLTGRDALVRAYLDSHPQVADLENDICQFVEKWLPSFKTDNRSYLTVAIGCTGGQHRSVYIAEQLARHFGVNEHVILRHRELS